MQSHKRFDGERERDAEGRKPKKKKKTESKTKRFACRQRQETGSRCNRVEETQGRAGCVEIP